MGCGNSKTNTAASEGTEGIKAVGEYTAEENAAAAKIQAGFRGHKVRADMKKQASKAPTTEWDRDGDVEPPIAEE